jgi:hypothetical protein
MGYSVKDLCHPHGGRFSYFVVFICINMESIYAWKSYFEYTLLLLKNKRLIKKNHIPSIYQL